MEVKNYCSWRNFCGLNKWSTQPTLNGHELIGTSGLMKMASSKREVFCLASGKRNLTKVDVLQLQGWMLFRHGSFVERFVEIC